MDKNIFLHARGHSGKRWGANAIAAVEDARMQEKPPLRGFSQRMKFGYTFIERGQNGSVVNSDFESFDSFQQCCTIAVKSFAAKPLERVEIVPCEYDNDRCHPQLISVLKTFKG